MLMRLFVTMLEREVVKMHANDIRLKVVGDLSRFNEQLQTLIANAERKTARNTRLTVTICANYGGRWDIMQAVNKMTVEAAANGQSAGQAYTEEQLAPHLAMAYAPEPDLFIARAASSAFPISCCGNWRTLSCFLPRLSGPTSMTSASTRQSRLTSSANGALAVPARN